MSTDLHNRLHDAFDTGATMPLSPEPAWRRGRRQSRVRTAIASAGTLGIAALAIAGIAAVSGPTGTPDIAGPAQADGAFVATDDAAELGPTLADTYASEVRGAISISYEAPITSGVIAVTWIEEGADGTEDVLLASSGDLTRQSPTVGSVPAPSAGEHVLRHEVRQCPPTGCSTVDITDFADLTLLSEPCEQAITTSSGRLTPVLVRWSAAEPATCSTIEFAPPTSGGMIPTVPDVTGLDVNEASKRLFEFELSDVPVAVPDRGRSRRVVEQSVAAGTPLTLPSWDDGVASGGDRMGMELQNVTILYADDTADFAPPVADVVGLTVDEAREELRGDNVVGYRVAVVYAYVGAAARAEDGEVIDQDVEPGTVREAASIVTVTVARR